jgi:serine/threonine-protein kinase
MHKVLQEEPLPPSKLNVQVPRAFDAVIQKALAKRPDERFQTAREFADAVRMAAAADATRPAAEATMLNLDATVKPSQAASATLRPPRAPAGHAAESEATIPGTMRTSAPAPAPVRKSQMPAIAAVAAVVVIAGAAGAAWFVLKGSGTAPQVAQPEPQPSAAPSAAPAAPPAAPAPVAKASPQPAPGTMVVSALGLADPTDPRYQGNQAALAEDLRADSRAQAVEKAIGLYLQQASLSQNYDWLRDKLLARSGDYIATVVQESEPKVGKDGLAFVTTQAVVKTGELRKSLNQMSRDERISFIRNNGDPKIAVRVSTRDADRPDAAAQASAIAENLLKERIKSFGFRTWSEEGSADKTADFSVSGEARIKKLSAKLQASGLTVTKYTLTSWTVKVLDRATGEEIYFNNALPKGVGSWASEEEALSAIGTKLADEFNRDFFLQHFGMTGQKVVLKVAGLDEPGSVDLFSRELIGLGGVLSSTPRGGSPRTYDLVLAGNGSPSELVANGILKPLNVKLGGACFGLGATVGDEVMVALSPACDKSALTQLETAPPAGLYAAPLARRRSVVKNPETLKKIMI